jgi:anti-sigma regulatory factor (Ser/Thr protein kinase)
MDGSNCPVRSLNGGTGAVHERSPTSVAPEPDSGAGTAIHLPHASALTLAALQTAPGCGRGHARNVLREWNLGHLADAAALLVSELVTNAVKASWHSGDPICLRLLAGREQLIIEVWDRNPDAPRPRQANYEDETGRGFSVIEHTANRWGYHRINSGWKVVWAELLTGGKI